MWPVHSDQLDVDGDYLFILAILAITGIFYYDLRNVSPAASGAPLIMIAFTAIASILALAHKLYLGDVIEGSVIDESDADVYEMIEESMEETPIDPKKLLREIVFISAFLVGMFYVGFFTSSFLFMFSYIALRDESETSLRGLITPIKWSVGITAFLYVFFVHILESGSVLQLGFTF